MRVREATPADLPALMGIIDGAMLAADATEVRERAAAGAVLVAVAGGERSREGGTERDDRGEEDGGGESEERILGACVLDGSDCGVAVDAIAVRRRRRGQGIGRALVERALDRAGRVTATFDDDVRPFYEAVGFSVRETGDGRCRGVLERADVERQG